LVSFRDQNDEDDSLTASVLDLVGLGRVLATASVSISSMGSSTKGFDVHLKVFDRFGLGRSVEVVAGVEVGVDEPASVVDDLSSLFFLENHIPRPDPRTLTVSVALGSISPGLC
jgi:hypothetical protein